MTSDHGGKFLRQGGFGHSHTSYEELPRVPLLVKSPERAPPEIETSIDTLDIAPPPKRRRRGTP